MAYSKTQKVIYIILTAVFFLACAFTIYIDIVLHRNPQIIFTHIHWAILFIGNIVMFLLAVIVGVLWLVHAKKIFIATIGIIVGLLLLFLNFTGISFAKKTTYIISSPKDIFLLNNLPTIFIDFSSSDSSKNIYQIVLENDLDFEGVSFEKPLGTEKNIYVINGQGHSIKNINYKTELNQASNTFWAMAKSSVLKNIVISDCEFELIPNYYNNEKHQGLECDFYFMGSNGKYITKNYEYYLPEFRNVEIKNIDVHIVKAEPDLRHTESTFTKFYPLNQNDENCIINITISEE